jgi:photosystem II stability/assembly factor-like uncharacterized protein
MTTGNFLEVLLQDAVYALSEADGALYAARSSGLYRSTDGVSWTPMPLGQDNAPVTAVAANGATLVAARGGTILTSDDTGASWRELTLTQPLPTVAALALIDGARLAATAQDGVFVSTDGGSRWVAWNYGLVDLNVNALALAPDGRAVWIGTESGLFRSVNGGRSWREVDFPLDAAPVLSVALTSDTVFAGADRGLWRSDDNGASWQRVEAVASAVQAMQTQGETVWLLLDNRLLRSDDSGASWQSESLPDGKMPTALLPTAQAVIVGFADGDLIRLSGIW